MIIIISSSSVIIIITMTEKTILNIYQCQQEQEIEEKRQNFSSESNRTSHTTFASTIN